MKRLLSNQHSQLSASYHQALTGGGTPDLTASKSSQNYDFIRINDTADSTVQIVTKQGAMVSATLNQSSDERTRDTKYERGQIVSDVTVPEETSSSKNLLSLLQPLIDSGDAQRNTIDWQQALTQIHGLILLRSAQ